MDPVNSSSSGLYYSYATNGTQYELIAPMESQKYQGNVNGSLGAGIATQGSMALQGPMVQWPLNEGSGNIATDQSGSGNNGAWQGNASGTNGYYSPGRGGRWAGAFNGSSTYIASPDLGSPPLSLTLSAWVRPTASGGVVFSEQSLSGWHASQMEVEQNNSINLCVWTGSETCIVAATGITYGNWYFVAMTYDSSSGSFSSYVNGVPGSRMSVVKQYPPVLYYFVGESDTTNGGNGGYFSGLISNVGIYGRALSPAEIMALYNAEK